MTITRKEIYAFVLLVCAAIVGAAYVHAKIGVARADQVREDVQQQIGSLRGDLKDALSKIAQDRQQAKTPQQIVQKLPQYIPGLPRPIYPVPGSTAGSIPTIPSAVPAALPDAPSVGAPGSLVIPAESATAFFQHETDCKADSLKLAECSRELPLVEKRAQAAERAMKGGSFWSRAKANSKWFVFGAAAGAAAYGISHR